MALILNTNIINDTEGGHLLDAKNIKGGYLVVDTNPNEITDRAILPRDTIVAGTLCYCTGDGNFYQYIAHEDEEVNVTYIWEVRKMFDGQPDSELLGAHAAALGINTQAVGVAGFATGIDTDARTRGAQAHGYSTQAGGLACKIIGQEDKGDGWGRYFLDGEYSGIEGRKYIVRLSSVSRTLLGEITFAHLHDTDSEVPEGQTRVDVTYYDNKLTIENEAYDENNYSQYPSDYLIVLPSDDSFDRVEIGNIEIGFNSFAAGDNNLALERASVAFGRKNKSLGQYAFTEGYYNIANYAAHAEGHMNAASGVTSHAEGREGAASGWASHTEGKGCKATADCAHAEGCDTQATENYTHAEGYKTQSTASGAHAEGGNTVAAGAYSHAEGQGTSTGETATSSHTEGNQTKTFGADSHAEGLRTIARGGQSHAEGMDIVAAGLRAHAEGDIASTANNYSYEFSFNNETLNGKNGAYGAYSHREGRNTLTLGDGAHAEGNGSVASGATSHAEGGTTEAKGSYSHAENYESKAYGLMSHTEGYRSITGGDATKNDLTAGTPSGAGSFAHAEGNATMAIGEAAHSEGKLTYASGEGAHAEGLFTSATGRGAHAEGIHTEARGACSHASGFNTIASGNQTVVGRFNSEESTALFIVGSGSSHITEGDRRKNCFSTGVNSNEENYIKIGNIELTESKLAKVLAFIDRIENIEGGI